ncbi:MAG: hypothetical protein K9K62_09415 [Desulfobacteraceae bacterium]|nr:hypothetical protein [Desulfobacteraceae bacterium]
MQAGFPIALSISIRENLDNFPQADSALPNPVGLSLNAGAIEAPQDDIGRIVREWWATDLRKSLNPDFFAGPGKIKSFREKYPGFQGQASQSLGRNPDAADHGVESS